MTADLPTRLLALVERLETLAAGARPGPWKTDWYYVVAEVPGGRPGGETIADVRPGVRQYGNPPLDSATATYIAAFGPDVARALAGMAEADRKRHQPTTVDVPVFDEFDYPTRAGCTCGVLTWPCYDLVKWLSMLDAMGV